MFEDLISEIDADIYRAQNNLQLATILERRAKEIQNQFEFYKNQLRNYYPLQNAFGSIQDIANDILWEEADSAITRTEEFDIPIFRDRLFAAIKDSRTIKMNLRGEQLNIIVDLNLTAGRISDYGAAIAATREQMNIGTMPPAAASIIWAEKIYGAGRLGKNIPPRSRRRKNRTAEYSQQYWETIRNRVDNFSSLAPFWQIIDRGTPSGSMPGSRGGTPYPKFGPTNFVDHASNRIKEQFNVLKEKEQKSYNELIIALDNLKEALVYIGTTLDDIGRIPLEERVRNAVESRLQSRLQFVKPERVQQLIDNLVAGVTVGGKQKRVYLGTTPMGRDISIRIKQIEQNLIRVRGNR